MHAGTILLQHLWSVLGVMHAARRKVLLKAVEALVQGQWLTLTELARHWPGAEFAHAPMKALDRLLSNPRMWQALRPLQQALTRSLLTSERPLILVDWSDLKQDRRWALLRAAVPVGGRALTVLEVIYPIKTMGQPATQVRFLEELAAVLPNGTRPILVTDAGFRSDWYRAVAKRGWDYIGRLRNNTKAKLEGARDWCACSSLHRRANGSIQDLGYAEIVQGDPWFTRLVLASRPRRRRSARTKSRDRKVLKARKAAAEPWLLVTSMAATSSDRANIVSAYSKRMQIEASFRDLKSHQYGVGFKSSLTRSRQRLAVLLMIHTLATFAAWIASKAIEKSDLPDPMTRQKNHHHRHSSIRRAFEWLRRHLPPQLNAVLRDLVHKPLTPNVQTWGTS